MVRLLIVSLMSLSCFSLGWAEEEGSGEELIIKIDRGITRSTTIALVPFSSSDNRKMGVAIDAVLANNFHLSGHFNQLDRLKFPSRPFRANQVIYPNWREQEAEYIVFGELTRLKRNNYQLNLSIADVLSERLVAQNVFIFDTKYQRDFAHYVSDYIYKKITGIDGSFSTKLLFVRRARGEKGYSYSLHLVDADGQREKILLSSDEPIISPAWSPDAKKVAYVSFENGRSNIYIQQISDGHRWLITNFKGINSAPAWSPDGKTLAVALSRESNVDIYLVDLLTHTGRRLTRDSAIDTEPNWSSDGNRLLFTSDRSGRPQIYEYELSTNKINRLTSAYSTSAHYTHGDDALVMVGRNERGRYNIMLYNLKNKETKPISNGFLDDSPSISPDGNRVVYTTRIGSHYRLALASVDLGNSAYLSLSGGDIRSPSWSPFIYQHNF